MSSSDFGAPTCLQIIITLLIASLQTAFHIRYFKRPLVNSQTQTGAKTLVNSQTQTDLEIDDSSDDECDINETLRSLHVSLTPPSSPQKSV